MGSKSSFYADSATVYSDTNPAGPADSPVVNDDTKAPSSFYKGSGRVYPTNSSADENVVIAVSVPGVALSSNEWLFGLEFEFSVTFKANMAGSTAYADVAPTSRGVLKLLKNGVAFGTVTFSSKTGVFSCPETVFAEGDVLTITADSTVDATLARFVLSLFGFRY